MAPHVDKAKTAFLFFQRDQLAAVKNELGGSMGEAMQELGKRWRALTDEQRQRYVDQEVKDRERFERESAEADALRLAEQEARQKSLFVQDGEDASKRGARARLQEERERSEKEKEERRLKREANMDEEERERRERIKEQKRLEYEERQRKRTAQDEALAKQHNKLSKEEARKASNRLEYLFKQSPIFAKLRMGVGNINDEDGDGEDADIDKKPTAAGRGQAGTNKALEKNRPHHIHDKDSADEMDDDEEEEGDQHVFLTQQPSVIKFGKLKPYQLESLNWMIHLAEKGLNGILADEMGLGKTLQSISILAYYYEFLKIQGPHLICVPKSTLSNWMNELNRWCPALRAIKFHGSREEREELVEEYFTPAAASHDGRRPDKQIPGEDGEMIDDNSDNPRKWDVCVTTYEVCNTERKTLQKFAWKYLVIDEAHRLKNDASMFSTSVRSFRTANRLLLTGTPLQNNLRELWALLNFLLPDIFASSDQFDSWFNLEIDDEEAKKTMISQLHKILRPFMLRRLKADVAKGLPPKTETIVMVGMSKMQKQLYKKLLLRDLDTFTGNNSGKNKTAILNIVMQLRKCCGHPYLFEGVEDRTLDPLGEHLVENCGKLHMVDKLLKRLKERGSRVLIFTQMTRVLDILEDYMVMRDYKYCRIDGNTSYDDREGQIDAFNEEGSDIFCFILSTRAGGLGINLQTADICILYDSDWNPQQDLQAQDRCHRLGQKKPVSVFRLVSENTIEEKIVERAQQKLKLDAMVVQQGRLKEKDKVSKEEMMAAVRFGADTIFRSEESTITDEDIDIILERGAAKTKELAEKIQKAEKGDLLDFRLDGGISAQTFEGIDYADKALRDQLRLLAANSIGKRERRPPPIDYNPIMHPKKSMVVNNTKIKLPKTLRLPRMEDHHFYNRERLLELGRLEFETYATLRQAGKLPPKYVLDKTRTLLPDEVGQEKIDLLNEGFGHWSRTQYFAFVKATAKYGREDITSIAAEMDMPEDQVQAYSVAFWKYGPTELKNEWERNMTMIEKGEKKLEKQKQQTKMLGQFIETFENPRDEMVFANKGTTHFALEQDRALLSAVNSEGYGNWDSIREVIRKDKRLAFQHSVRGMTTFMITKRVDYRMRQMERELDAREKALKNKRPASVIAAQNALQAIKDVEKWEADARARELQGKDPPSLDSLGQDAKDILVEQLKDRQKCISRIREIEGQNTKCMFIAEETRQAIYRGDQYINYSNITLKGPAGSAAQNGEEKKQLEVLPEIESGEMEAKVSKRILLVQECGHCENCNGKSGGIRKLCLKRLEARKRLVAEETAALEKIHGIKRPTIIPKTNAKKRKFSGDDDEGSKKKIKKALSSNESSGLTRKRSRSSNSLSKPKVKVDENGIVKKHVTSLGNKKMAVPDDALPMLCGMIGAKGTGERMKVINEFAARHPTVSVRQATIKVAEITVREPPACVDLTGVKLRAFMFYLRPAFYKYLPPEERPENWEKYAEDDEAKYRAEYGNSIKRSSKKKSVDADSIDSSDRMSGAETADATDDDADNDFHDDDNADDTDDDDDDVQSYSEMTSAAGASD